MVRTRCRRWGITGIGKVGHSDGSGLSGEAQSGLGFAGETGPESGSGEGMQSLVGTGVGGFGGQPVLGVGSFELVSALTSSGFNSCLPPTVVCVHAYVSFQGVGIACPCWVFIISPSVRRIFIPKTKGD